MTRFLSLDDLLVIVDALGVGPVRDIGLLDSARQRPSTTVWGEDAYPDLFEKAAALLESVTRGHPLMDGNKRLGWVSVVVFLGLNGVRIVAPEDDAYDLVIGVSTGTIDRRTSASLLARWSTG